MTPALILESLGFTVGAILSTAQFFLLLYIAWLWTTAHFGDHRCAIKLSCDLVAVLWTLAAVFLSLIFIGLFQWFWGSLAIVGLTLLIWKGQWQQRNRKLPSRHAVRFTEAVTQVPVITVVLLFATTFVAGLRISRGLIAPPLAWDSLTYHLLKAGRWVQSSSWIPDKSPDSWKFYEYFPPLGDVYWAWAMLSTKTDALVPLASALFWVASGVATYLFARQLKVKNELAVLAMLTALSVPASLALITSAYVDSAAMAVITLGSTILIGAVQKKSPSLAAVALAAMSLGAGIKLSFLPYVIVAAAAYIAYLKHSSSPRKLLVITVLGTAVGLFWQLVLLFTKGSPLYPAPFKLLGFTINAGQPEFLAHHYPDGFELPYLWEVSGSFWTFLTGTEQFSPTHQNFTWAFAFLLPLAVIGLFRLLKQERIAIRALVVSLFGAGLLVFITFWTPQTAYYRGLWLTNLGRLFLPWYAILVVLVTFVPSRLASIALQLTILINVFYAYPRVWGQIDYIAALCGALILILLVGSIYFLVKFTPKIWSRLAAAALLVLTFSSLYLLRSHFRYQFYRNTDTAYDVIRVPGRYLPVDAWEYLDTMENQVIAFASRYHGAAYTWFRYPLLGSRLQNQVVYISPTASGEPWSESINPDPPPVSYESWRKSLSSSGVDYLLLKEPYFSELQWALNDQTFQLIKAGEQNRWLLFAVK